MARQDNADRAKEAKLLLVVKKTGMTDGRRRCRQDIDGADGKRDGVAKMHARNCVIPTCGHSVWENDNHDYQDLHAKLALQDLSLAVKLWENDRDWAAYGPE